MQLGTRWAVGATPPPRLEPDFIHVISEVEAQLAGIDTSTWRWTLTWLESRPVAELDDGTVVRATRDGIVVVRDTESE